MYHEMSQQRLIELGWVSDGGRSLDWTYWRWFWSKKPAYEVEIYERPDKDER